MRTAILWGLLALFCQHTLVTSHVLGRSYTTGNDLAQLKSLLERLEETLAEVAPEESPVPNYEGTDQESEQPPATIERTIEQEEAPRALVSEEPEPSPEGHSRLPSQRSRLQGLLMATRTRSSGCFGGRMDRIGNSSGLGCGRG